MDIHLNSAELELEELKQKINYLEFQLSSVLRQVGEVKSVHMLFLYLIIYRKIRKRIKQKEKQSNTSLCN